jgi:hypothetical protein
MKGSNALAERRKHPRIQLLAYGFNHECAIRKLDDSIQANLIDISPGGARLKLTGAGWNFDPARGDAISFNPGIQALPELCADIPAEIRWIREGEIGIFFQKELSLAVSDLQRFLTK